MMNPQTDDVLLDIIRIPFNNDNGGPGGPSSDNRGLFVSRHDHSNNNGGNVGGNTTSHIANQLTSSNKLEDLVEPGGVLLEINQLKTVDNSQFANMLGSKVAVVSKERGTMAEIIIDGKKYVVTRSSSTTLKGHNQSTKQYKKQTKHRHTIIGRYSDYQIDLLIGDDKRSLVTLQRFYDSTSIKKNGQGVQWTWQPFELRLDSKVPAEVGNG